MKSITVQWEAVQGIYSAFGGRLLINQMLTDSGYTYDNGVFGLSGCNTGGDGVQVFPDVLALHDLSHWLVSKPENKNLPNFGIGPSGAFGEAKCVAIMPDHAIRHEEQKSATVMTFVCAYIGMMPQKHISILFRRNWRDEVVLTSLRELGLIVASDNYGDNVGFDLAPWITEKLASYRSFFLAN